MTHDAFLSAISENPEDDTPRRPDEPQERVWPRFELFSDGPRLAKRRSLEGGPVVR